MDIKLYFKDETIKSIKFHKNGKIKKEKYYNGTIVEYDERGNCIHCKHSNGEEAWSEYDERGNVLYYRDSYDNESLWEYDKNNKCIYFKINDRVLIDRRTNKGE